MKANSSYLFVLLLRDIETNSDWVYGVLAVEDGALIKTHLTVDYKEGRNLKIPLN